jgi:hypothetical protein
VQLIHTGKPKLSLAKLKELMRMFRNVSPMNKSAFILRNEIICFWRTEGTFLHVHQEVFLHMLHASHGP